MGLNLGDLEARITKGRERIAEAKALGMQVSDWESYLVALEKEYEAAVTAPKAIAFQTKNDFQIFTNHTLPQVQEWLLARTIDEIKQIYLPNTYQWVETHRPDSLIEIKGLEEKIDSFNLSPTNVNEFKSLLQFYWEWHAEALRLHKKDQQTEGNERESIFFLESQNKGGDTAMPLIAKAPERRSCPIGAHKGKVEKIEPKHHQEWGERVLFTFLLDGKAYDDGKAIRVFTEASNTLTRKSKPRKIVEGILGRKLTKEETQGFDLETLVGLECQIVIKHEEGIDGNTYSRVETVISL